jgi:N-formylglutamate amidohydrolase
MFTALKYIYIYIYTQYIHIYEHKNQIITNLEFLREQNRNCFLGVSMLVTENVNMNVCYQILFVVPTNKNGGVAITSHHTSTRNHHHRVQLHISFYTLAHHRQNGYYKQSSTKEINTNPAQ